MNETNLTAFLNLFGHQFQNADLIAEALRHSSYVNEQIGSGLCDNERLEFLGDAVLNLVIGHMLMVHYPDIDEGELSRMRANLVNESQLALIARRLELGSCILLGKGERLTNGQDKSSILANTLEAVIAAVYLDSGFQEAFRIIETHFQPLLDEHRSPALHQDHKSRLQERVQLENESVPLYQVVEECGPDHDKTFRVQLTAMDIRTEGSGKSKKMAEQNAARKALQIIDGHVAKDAKKGSAAD